MTCVDETLESGGTAVGVMRRVQIGAVVTPAPAAGEFVHRHQFDMGNPELEQMIQFPDGGFEGSFRGKSADMKLVDNSGGKRRSLPVPIAPGKFIVRKRA